MKLLRNLVLVKRKEASEKFDDGILFKPDGLKVKPPEGTVVEVGPEVEEVRVGDQVIYGKFSAQEIEDCVLVCESDIVAIIK